MMPENSFCRIYEADVAPLASSALFDLFYARVPAARRAKVDRLRAPEAKRLSLGAGALLVRALSSAGLDGSSVLLSEGPQGKPFLPDFPDLQFNLSHAGTRVLCVLSSLPCGGDVERLGRGSPALARRFFAPDENAVLEAERSAGGEEAFQAFFTRIWTRKESFLKATGEGLFRPLSRFSVLSPDPCVRFFERSPELSYASCVCLLAPPDKKGPDAECIWPVPEWIRVSPESLAEET